MRFGRHNKSFQYGSLLASESFQKETNPLMDDPNIKHPLETYDLILTAGLSLIQL